MYVGRYEISAMISGSSRPNSALQTTGDMAEISYRVTSSISIIFLRTIIHSFPSIAVLIYLAPFDVTAVYHFL